MSTATLEHTESLLSSLNLDEAFYPAELHSENDSGLSPTLIEDLILKYLSGRGSASGRSMADHLCLPLVILEDRYSAMRSRQDISPVTSGMLGDHVYRLTDQGRERAQRAIDACAYAGPAPVPLEDYVNSVRAQNIRSEKPRRKQLEAAFADILVSPELLAQLGPATNAGRGLFIMDLQETAKQPSPSELPAVSAKQFLFLMQSSMMVRSSSSSTAHVTSRSVRRMRAF